MNFTELAKKRCSVRSYTGEKLKKEELEQILEAGRLAPTAKNLQPQRILVIESDENLEKMKEITNRAEKAGAILLVCADKKNLFVNPFDNRDTAETDTSIVATHIILKAAELGIGSCWVCMFDREKARKAFSVPDDFSVECIISLGYPADDFQPTENHTKYKDMNELVYFEKF
ncbi:MAG: nitroreductase family protein [Clostridiales bacterium]|nr:nitroreductase family protein [Clostridiales bacterium]